MEEAHAGEDILRYITRIEHDYTDVRDRLLTSASAGLSLLVVIHEVEKGIDALTKAVQAERSGPRVLSLAQHLSRLVEGLGAIARGSGSTKNRASSLVEIALLNSELRTAAHGIDVTVDTRADFEAPCSRRLVISTLMNLIDNSIWWLENRWGRENRRKKLFIGTSRDFALPAIVVADNGSGFSDPPEYLVQPFFTRKPEGMGLGLHLADQVMNIQGGRLEFPERDDLELSVAYDGAVVALLFGGAKWKE